MPAPETGRRASLSRSTWTRLLPLAAVLGGLVAFFALGLHSYLSFEQLRHHRGELMAFVAARPALAVLAFVAVYTTATALSLPGGGVLTLTGGFLFGMWLGTAAVVLAATAGATLLFLIARSALGDPLRARAGPFIARLEDGFRENAFSYLLALRLIPAVPFVVVNLVPAFLGVPLRTFIVATFLGIVPGTFVFASVGAGLGSIFDSMKEVSLQGALTSEVLIALAGLAALSMLPVFWKWLRAARARAM